MKKILHFSRIGLLFIGIAIAKISTAQSVPYLAGNSAAQNSAFKNHAYDAYFQNAYSQNPNVPQGILEAVAFTMTRIHHLDSVSNPGSCIGLPRVYGVMGLTLDGKNYFRNNLLLVSQLSGYSVNDIISDAEINILAFAKAYSVSLVNLGITSNNVEDHLPVLAALSELPNNNLQTDFALNSHVYSVLTFLNSLQNQAAYGFPNYNINLINVFGQNNYNVLSATKVIISKNNISNNYGQQYKQSGNIPVTLSADYPPALWNAAASCNYTVGRSQAVSAVVIHDVEGSYAGCISWFQNCSAQVSAHYVARSSDGQLTQMVLEKDKAWHVGTENPYTIGIEHEGYVNQTGWYTVAMYQGSANLIKDICNSGYGINPLRTYYGPSCNGCCCLVGNCIRIKGHQMYPNQTHDDPGPNWDWYYYYDLINNTTPVTTLNTATGNFYDSGGPSGNYSDDERTLTLISPPGATSITLTFTSFSLEANWDYMYIYDGNSLSAPLLGTYTSTTSPGTITSSGGSLLIQFRSDCATTDIGWNASWTSTSGTVTTPTNLTASVSSCPNNDVTLTWNNSGTGWYIDVSDNVNFTTFYNKNIDNLTSTNCPAGFCDYPNCTTTLTLQPNTTYYWRIWNGSTHTNGISFTTNNCDGTPPTTNANVTGNWQTQNFTTNFSDADNVSVAQSFYQVMDWNGTEWRANSANGFFNDNFDTAINSEWTSVTGTWGISSAYINQSDETNSNTNIYAMLAQNSSYTYLYHFQMNMGGTGTNRRAGLHFFSDDSTLPNRGNGYFVYFRVDNLKAQIYRVASDVFTLESDVAYTFNANTFYDFKTTYNPSSGEIKVYVNDVFVSSWTDTAPFTSGNSMSLRTGNANVLYNDLKVYRSRNSSEVVTIGNSSADVRYQNPNPSTPSCRIKSIVIDGSENWSTPSTLNVNIDWTPPADVSVNDGSSNDIDTTNIATELSANWTASSDIHSAIATYWYAIGTSQGATDVVNWVNYGMNTSVTHTGLSLTYGTTYYFSVQVENGAGLLSNIIYSDGQILLQPIPPPTATFATSNTTVCSGESVNFQNNSIDATNYLWTFQNGNPSTSTATNPSVTYANSGTYSVTLIAYSTGNTSDTTTQNISVTVNSSPSAAFSASPATVYQPNPTVNFTNSSANATSYQWNFGDGTTSNQQNPSHTYPDTGYYSVTLIAFNGLCPDDTLTMTNYIYVGPDPTLTAPVASFFLSGSGFVCAGNEVSFFNSSTNATSYQWSFPGGAPATSTATNPSVTYNISGSYSVTLIATGPGGTNTIQQTISINVVTPPVADFSANDTLAYMPNATINFLNLSTDATSYSWDFGDGTTSPLTDPSHTFNATGFYTVTLIAGNDNCPNDTITFTNYIEVIDTTSGAQPPVAGFTNSTTTICAGDLISFTNSSINATSFSWTFTGGTPSTSTATNPSVSYTNSGTYNVSLIATGTGGSDTASQTITVNIVSAPVAAFNSNDTVVYLPSAIVFFTNSSSGATSYLWNFDDGTTSNQQDPWHQYNDTGYYTVTLIAINSNCPNDTLVVTNYIHVEEPSGFKSQISNLKSQISVYPNPAQNIFTVEYSLPTSQNISIKLIDVLGKEIFILRNKNQNAGKQRLTVDSKGMGIAKGVYVIRLYSENMNQQVKLVIE